MIRNEKGQFIKDTMRVDITGEKFNMLTALEFSHVEKKNNSRRTYWFFQCDCGNIKVLRIDQVKSGNTQSCGCNKLETNKNNISKSKESNLKYDKNIALSRTNEYSRWRGIIRRCYDKFDSHYNRYGGRGIKVCNDWRYDFNAFYYWCQQSGYSKELQIDRIDNDGNYTPENCRWVTGKENVNNRSTTIKITFRGTTQSVSEWCEHFNFNVKKAYYLHDEKGISYENMFEILHANAELSNQIA